MAKLDIYLATENHLGEIEIVDSDIIEGNNLNDCFEQFQEVEEEYASTNYEVGILDKDVANEYYDRCQKMKGEQHMENQIDLWVESINTAIWHELNKIDHAGEDKAPDKSIRKELQEKAQEIYQKIKKDYVAYTEFVIALNHKCWDWYRIANATVEKKDEARKRAISKNYAELYYLYDTQFFRDYKDNKEALQYFIEVTD